jgi:formyl-CoA transferase/CoA:oxalate CoA-transferase
MLDATAALLTYQAGIYFATGRSAPRMGNRHPTIAPYETFAASDGDFVLAVGNDEQWRRFCAVARLDALASDPRFQTNQARVSNHDALRPPLAARLSERPRGEWIRELTAAGVPCGSVRDVAEVLADKHLQARSMIEVIQHASAGPIRVLGVPIKLSDTPGRVRTAPPTLGQHTEEILRRDVGLTSSEIASLRASGAV